MKYERKIQLRNFDNYMLYKNNVSAEQQGNLTLWYVGTNELDAVGKQV